MVSLNAQPQILFAVEMSQIAEIETDVELVKLVSSNLMPVVVFDNFSLTSTVFEVLNLLFVVGFLFLCAVYLVFISLVSFLVCGVSPDKAGSQVG